MTDYMLTTIDNPFNPFKEWDAWYQFDVASGYNTAAFLARVAKTSDELSETDEDLAITQAVDEIISENVLGIYIKIDENGNKSMNIGDHGPPGEGSRKKNPPSTSPDS